MKWIWNRINIIRWNEFECLCLSQTWSLLAFELSCSCMFVLFIFGKGCFELPSRFHFVTHSLGFICFHVWVWLLLPWWWRDMTMVGFWLLLVWVWGIVLKTGWALIGSHTLVSYFVAAPLCGTSVACLVFKYSAPPSLKVDCWYNTQLMDKLDFDILEPLPVGRNDP